MTEAIRRLYMVQPSEGERYYLQTLLTHVKGATSFDDLKSVNRHSCRSFKEACIYLGLLQDDAEWDACLRKASQLQTGQQLRHLFAMILLFCQPITPEDLWNTHKSALCENILYRDHQLTQNQNNNVSNSIENKALDQLENYLHLNGKLLKDFSNMPLPSANIDYNTQDLDRLIREERSYNTIQLKRELDRNVLLLNEDQHAIYDTVIQVIQNRLRCFFVDGPDGTGKTFLYNTLLTNIRSNGDIALAVASSEIAAFLISGGRTAHSRFKIPINLDLCSTCNISRRSKKARLINITKLFIWDEALMIHKFAFEAVNRTFCNITQIDEPFGGKTFVFGGDFHQILPVIPRASRADVVSASLHQSDIWKHMELTRLTINMRLHQMHDP